MLTAKELMQPRYKALMSFRVKDKSVILTFNKGDIMNIEDRDLKLCPPDSVRLLQWWECREPEDMPQFVKDKHRQPYTEYKKQYRVKMPFSNIERDKFQLAFLEPGTGGDFTAPIENFVPVDGNTVMIETSYDMGKTGFAKRVLRDHTLGCGFKQDQSTGSIGYAPGQKLEQPTDDSGKWIYDTDSGTAFFVARPGCSALPDDYAKIVDELRKKVSPFLLRLKEANEKKCPILKASSCSVKPQVQVLNISTAVGELCSHILYHGTPLDFETNKQNIADSIGDIGILLDSLSQRIGLSFQQCMQIRFNRLSLKQGSNDCI